jgi:predicted AAA+ superfamily ATPase
MIPRQLQKPVLELAGKVPVVTITGPRQSGKTTLARSLFPYYSYKNLEYPDVRQFAVEDPRGFLEDSGAGIILDEIQRVPALLSYIQGIVDERNEPGKYILTGSQNLLLSNTVSQTLAGRTAIFNLLPFSIGELGNTGIMMDHAEPWIQRGFFPRLYDADLGPEDWIPFYISTYIERDIRDIINVHNLTLFQTFLQLCAGRTGQLLNLSSLGNDCGIDQKTARNWISVLEATFTVFLLPSFHRNFSKRLIKSPKLYFYDTGIACWLLGIRSAMELESHYLRGNLFENLILCELIKKELNGGRQPGLHFWRESNGREVDCVYEQSGRIYAIECKAGRTVTSDYFSGINHFRDIAGDEYGGGAVIYGGRERQTRSGTVALPWRQIAEWSL